MGYDYSLDFLARNVQLMKNLVRVASSGEVLSFESDRWESIRDRQQLVNNVLANMARNVVEYSDIRKTVRCWTEFRGEKYYLYVGVAQHRVVGRPPGQEAGGPSWMETYVPASLAGSSIYVHPNMVQSEEELATFVGRVVSLPAACMKAEVQVEELTDDAVKGYFAAIFEPYGWRTSRTGDTLQLDRTPV